MHRRVWVILGAFAALSACSKESLCEQKIRDSLINPDTLVIIEYELTKDAQEFAAMMQTIIDNSEENLRLRSMSCKLETINSGGNGQIGESCGQLAELEQKNKERKENFNPFIDLVKKHGENKDSKIMIYSYRAQSKLGNEVNSEAFCFIDGNEVEILNSDGIKAALNP